MLMSLIETRDKSTIPLSELSLSDRSMAWEIKLDDLAKVETQLFKEGEQALSSGIKKLGEGIPSSETAEAPRYLVRLPLKLPQPSLHTGFRFALPEQLNKLIESLELSEYSLKQKADLSAKVPKLHYDYLELEAHVGEESFNVAMQYHPASHSVRRSNEDVVWFSGFSSARFERDIDRIKDLNRSDPKAKLSVALGMLKIIADLKG